MQVCFWGVRGSMPQSGIDYQIGGHTSCISIYYDDFLVVFDGGSGISNLSYWYNEHSIKKIFLCLSHAHLDHLIGLPFFKPLWESPSTNPVSLHFFSYTLEPYGGVQKVLERIISPPYFPITFKDSNAHIEYSDVPLGNTVSFPNAKLSSHLLDHPGKSVGYRLDTKEGSIVYLSDSAPLQGEAFDSIVQFCKEARLIIVDTTFTEEEAERYPTWGHGTLAYATAVACAAKVQELALYHHGPYHTDSFLFHLEKKAKEQFSNSFLAQQGLVKTYK